MRSSARPWCHCCSSAASSAPSTLAARSANISRSGEGGDRRHGRVARLARFAYAVRAWAEEHAMQDLDEFSVTEAALAQMANTPDPRLKQIMDAAVRHLHAF